MARSVVMLSLLCLLLPAGAFGAALDDYYLTKFGERAVLARSLRAVVGLQDEPAERCRTHLYRSLKRDFPQLEPATQKTLGKFVGRPPLASERICSPQGGHFNIHYAASGSDAPDPTDGNSNGVPDWVETVAGVFEYVYDVEVNKMGYAAPPGTKYDVYLRDLTGEGAYGLTSSDGVPASPATSVGSYIEIDRAFSHPMFTVNGRYTPLQMLRITAAHEFHHAIQFGYNYYFDIWFGEVTSTWVEDEIYDSVNQLYSYLNSYFSVASTLALNGPAGGNSEYGRWIFNRYLTEAQGSRTVVRAMWEELGAEPANGTGSDIPMLPIIQRVLQNNFGNNFLGFAKRVVKRDWNSGRALELSSIPVLTPLLTASVAGTIDVSAPTSVASTPNSFGHYRYTPSNGAGQPLILNMVGLPSNMAVVALKSSSSGWEEYAYNSGAGSITIPAFTTGSTVFLVFCNNGGDMSAAAAVSPAFGQDAHLVSDGSSLDANTLAIPPVTVVSSQGGGGGGGCFVATAAYGSYLHPKVALLRQFRDRHLLTNAPGRLFVSLYYRLSPPVADVIAENEWMRTGARSLLVPVVLTVEHPVAALGTMLLISGCLMARRRRRVDS